MLVDGGGCLKGPKRVFGSIGPEGVLWDMSHRQVVEPLATCLSAWGQTRKIKENFILGSVCYFTSIKSICSLAFFKKKIDNACSLLDEMYKVKSKVLAKRCCFTLHYQTSIYTKIFYTLNCKIPKFDSYSQIHIFPSFYTHLIV